VRDDDSPGYLVLNEAAADLENDHVL